jgi:hypothetical protein
MTDGGDQNESWWTDERWAEWRDYADSVNVIIEFTQDLTSPVNAESWVLTPKSEAAWSQDWLQRQLVELATEDMSVGQGLYTLDTRDQKTSWGATGAAYEIVLTLLEATLTAATWEGVKYVAKNMAAKIREQTREKGWDSDFARGRVDDHQAEWSARYRVQLRRNTGTPHDLVLKSMAMDDDGGSTVVLYDGEAGIAYEVEVALIDGLVEMSRIRKVSYE